MIWIFSLFAALAAAVQIPKTGFSCDGRSTGYYADVKSGCQVYHMCDGLGRQFSYTCPNATLFQQRMLICDHWYMVNCSRSEENYAANLRIGQREMPFVDESETNMFHRTPRPDLLTNHNQTEYDIIYRTGRAQLGNSLNLVGAESDKPNGSSTDQPAYSLPSHWFTEYNQSSITSKSKIIDKSILEKGKPFSPVATEPSFVNFKSNFKATTPVFPLAVESSSPAPNEAGLIPPRSENDTVSFQSNFKATTPVFPLSVENTSPIPNEAGLVPPLGDNNTIPAEVNYQSNFNATTPVYPEVAPAGEETPQSSVVFKSDFKATTPVYPKTVELTSEEPADLGILPPESAAFPSLSLDIEPPIPDEQFERNKTEENLVIQEPSQFYQPPKFLPDYTEERKETEGFKTLTSQEWEDLRKKFLIPDYEFPLETVSRPSYDSVLSSFQADGAINKK